MLAVGEVAPDFTGNVPNGSPLTLSSLRGRPVVLYFYPKANTLGCTIEARAFSERFDDFERGGVAVVGVSVDPDSAQRAFADRCGIPFPLVADTDGAIARRFGVLGRFGMARRVTFLLDPQGRVLEVVEGMRPGPHVRRAVERFLARHGP